MIVGYLIVHIYYNTVPQNIPQHNFNYLLRCLYKRYHKMKYLNNRCANRKRDPNVGANNKAEE